MTIDLSAITYQVVAVLSDGSKLNLETVAENIAWEENENELSMRLNLTLRDVELDTGGRLSSKLALCTVVYLFANWDGTQREVFRGTIWDWEHPQIYGEKVTITCYDLLYYAQKSQDNRYFSKNTKTKDVLSAIFKAWGLTMGVYSAPNEKHGKLLYKNKTVASMITETLKDAEELSGGTKSFVRANAGKVDVVEYGANADVFGFYAGQNIVQSSDRYSMTDLVTRVLVTGKEDKNGRPKTETTLNGLTQYGILQTIHARGSASLSEAKKAAQKILQEKGKPKRITTIRAMEFPGIRKGDKVFIQTDSMSQYFYVTGVAHNATNAMMQMEVEAVE